MKTAIHILNSLEWHRESLPNQSLTELPAQRPQKAQLDPPEPEVAVSDGAVCFFTIVLGLVCLGAMYLLWARVNNWWPF